MKAANAIASVAVGTTIAGGAYLWDRATTSTHDWILRKACNTAIDETTDTASVYVAHVNDDVDADGHCAGVLDTERVPDLIVSDFAGQSLVAEVEDETALDDRPDEAAAQLSAFATPGYRRVLVTDDTDTGEQFVDDYGLDGVEVVTHSEIGRLL